MSKYIIEINDIGIENVKDGEKYHRVTRAPWWYISETNLNRLDLYNETESAAEQRGAEKAWEFVRWIWEEADLIEVFHMTFGDVLAMGYQDARAKTDEWKQEKEKEDDEIKVGDEVRCVTDHSKTSVVTNVKKLGNNNTQYNCVRADGITHYLFSSTRDFERTGRHFPEVVELLKEIGGNNNE